MKNSQEIKGTRQLKSLYSEEEACFKYFLIFFPQVIDKETIDLLAFSSVAELELLGLEKLKCELIALGLKCGGTLQERAARLFSVRGLAKEQIDPALFAKPLKGKKK